MDNSKDAAYQIINAANKAGMKRNKACFKGFGDLDSSMDMLDPMFDGDDSGDLSEMFPIMPDENSDPFT